MRRTDKIVWQILALTGPNFINHRVGLYGKCFRIFFIITFIFELIYIALINFCILGTSHYKEGITYLLLPVFCALMWYFAYSRSKEISDVLLKISNYRKKVGLKKSRSYIMTLLIIVLLSPLIMCIFSQIILDLETKSIIYYAFQYEIRSKILRRIILFNGNFVYLVFCVGFPIYLTFCLNILFYRCSDMLFNYNAELQTELRSKANVNIEILKTFFNMTKLMKKLDHAVMHLSFLIVFYSLHAVFSVLLTMSIDVHYKFKTEYLSFEIVYFTFSTIMFVSYAICCSMVPENLITIKSTVREFMNEYAPFVHVTKQNVYYLQRIENEEIVYMSACGLFPLTRSFILSAFGAIFSYGLLVTSLKL